MKETVTKKIELNGQNIQDLLIEKLNLPTDDALFDFRVGQQPQGYMDSSSPSYEFKELVITHEIPLEDIK